MQNRLALRWVYVLLVGLVGIASATSVAAEAFLLVKDGQAVGRIITSSEPSSAETFTAEELQIYLEKISGAKLPIEVTDTPGEGPAIIVGRHPMATDVIAQMTQKYPDKYEAFAIVTQGDKLFLLGAHETATAYAAWDWLESLGVRWLMPSPMGEYVPKMNNVAVDPITRFDAPKLDYRGPNYGMSTRYGAPEAAVAIEHDPHNASMLYSLRMRLNNNCSLDSADSWPNIGSGHSYHKFLPVGRYYDEHPEWFNLIGGKRLKARPWQVCFTNAEGAAQFAKNLMGSVEATHTRHGIPVDRMRLFVSPNDYKARCECENCQKLVDRDGSSSSLVVHFANMVAEHVVKRYPDAKIVFYAYDNYGSPPDHVKPAPGVYPELTFWTAASAVSANHSQPMFSDGNEKYRSYFSRWADMSDGISSHTYYGHYEWFTPWPKITQMTHDIPIMAKNENFYGMYSQTQVHWGTQGLNLYLHPKLMWNPDLNAMAVIKDYYEKAFGPAAVPIRSYFHTLQRQMDELPRVGGYSTEIPKLLTPKVVAVCDGFIETAEKKLDRMNEPMRWRTELVIDAWRASAKIGEATRLFTSSSSPEDGDRILLLLDEVKAFATTERGRWAFEHRMVEHTARTLRGALDVPLDGLSSGEHVYNDSLGYGGAVKFRGEVEGFQPGLWGYALPANGQGQIELPVRAAEGHVITAASLSLGVAYTKPVEVRISVLDDQGQEHLLTENSEKASDQLVVPTEAIGSGTRQLTFRIQVKALSSTRQTVLTRLRTDLTVAPSAQ